MIKIKTNYFELYDLIRKLYVYPSFYLGNGKAFFMPLVYVLCLTYLCNLNCEFCYRKFNEESNLDELSTQKWIDLINQIPENTFTNFLGGEVLIRKDFIDIFKKASQKHKTILTTNGILLEDEILLELIKNKLSLLSVSIDAIGEKHNQIRKSRINAFDKIYNNLNNFNKLKNGKKPPLEIKTMVLKDNINELLDVYRLACELNADYITFSLAKDHELQHNSNLTDALIPDFYDKKNIIKPYFNLEYFLEVFSKINVMSKTNKPQVRFYPRFVPKSNINYLSTFYNNVNNTELKNLYCECFIPWQNVSIAPNGDVFPCLSYKVGNIKNTPLKEIWNGERYIEFRQMLKKHKIISACETCCQLSINCNNK